MGDTNLNNIGSTLAATYNSSSGCDIIPTIDGIIIGNCNGISLSTTREKSPIYALGSTDAIAFGRGKRGHAGSIICTNFDRHALYDVMENASHQGDDPKRYWYFRKSTDIPSGGRSKFLDANIETALGNLGVQLAKPNYVDQIPPFTITLSMLNEYGSRAVMHILGVELINEGTGISIDDIVTETQFTFVARAIVPWYPIGMASRDVEGSQSIMNSNYNISERLSQLAVVRQAESAAAL